MIVAYSPSSMGFTVPQYMGFNISKSIGDSIKAAQKTIVKKVVAAKEIQAKNTAARKKIIPLVMIAGAGIAGIMIFKKSKKAKK